MMDNSDIEQLIAQCSLGNQSAFSQLYDATSKKLFSVCLRVLDNRDTAEDALQETYIKIWRNAAQYHRNGLNPMTWLITIARNAAIDRLRAQRQPMDSIDDHEDIESDMLFTETRK